MRLLAGCSTCEHGASPWRMRRTRFSVEGSVTVYRQICRRSSLGKLRSREGFISTWSGRSLTTSSVVAMLVQVSG